MPLVIGPGVSPYNAHKGTTLNPIEYTNYLLRVAADGGIVADNSKCLKIIKGLKDAGLLENQRFCWAGGMGAKLRTVSPYNYATKLYSLDALNYDAIQETTTKQPFVETDVLNIPYDTVQMVHTAVSFTAVQTWSVAIAVNVDGQTDGSSGNIPYGSNAIKNFITINRSNFRQSVKNNDSVTGSTVIDFKTGYGKLVVYHFCADGANCIKVYIDGAYVSTLTLSNAITLSHIISGLASTGLMGRLHYVSLKNICETQQNVTDEFNLLSSVYSNPFVVIGANAWEKYNCSVINNSNANVIPLLATWTNGTKGYCYHISSLGCEGKLYNKAARDIIKLYPPTGRKIPTEAQLTTLAALGGNAIKSALGISVFQGQRNADGNFTTYDETITFWCSDSDKVLRLYKNTDVAEIVAATANEGHSIRFMSDG